MATAAQITANHANAQLCTGPRTAEGKDRSSRNAVRHGLTSTRIVLPGENQADFDALLAGFTESWAPVNLHEETLVRQLTENYWKHLRATRVEREFLIAQHAESPEAIAALLASPAWAPYERLLKYAAGIENAYYRSLRALERLRETRRREEERQKREAAAEAKQAAAEARRHTADAKRRSEELLQDLLTPANGTLAGSEGPKSVSFYSTPQSAAAFSASLQFTGGRPAAQGHGRPR